MPAIFQIEALPDDICELASKAREEGFVFLDRLIKDFGTGENTFAKTGEALFAVRDKGRLVAVGGLNIDPRAHDQSVGRVRRLYVDPESRRDGVGKMLMEVIEQAARKSFSELRLLTDTERGARFYNQLGYRQVSGLEHVSHIKSL